MIQPSISRSRRAQAEGLTGRHVLVAFLSFFAAIFAVNGYFLYTALSTHTGVVAVEPYRKGLAYNERIAADERQAALGWRSELAVSIDGTMRVKLSEKDGRALDGLHVFAVVSRPTTQLGEQRLQLPNVGAGVYATTAAALAEGSWIVAFEASERAGGPPVHRERRRLWLKP